MGIDTLGNSSDSSERRKPDPSAPDLSAPARSNELVLEASAAMHASGNPADWVAEIDTTSVTDADASRIVWPDAPMVRTPLSAFFVALLAGLAGVLAAGTFMAITVSLAERDPSRQLPTDPAVLDGNYGRDGFTTILIFFGTMYFAGDVLYGMLGHKAEQQQVRLLRRNHLPLVGLIAGACVAFSPSMNVARGTAMPRDWLLMSVGLVILAYSIHGIILAIRNRVPYTSLLYRR
jgi:hypothetical protein